MPAATRLAITHPRLHLELIESGRSIALLPALVVTPDHAVTTRELSTPVHRNVTIVVRRGTPQRAAVNAVVAALRDHPEIPALTTQGPLSR